MIVELISLISLKKKWCGKIVPTIIYARKYAWHYDTLFTIEKLEAICNDV